MGFPGFRRRGTATATTPPAKIVVWHTDQPHWMVRRTVRRLDEQGLEATSVPLGAVADLIDDAPIAWLVRAGAIPPGPGMLRVGRDSATILLGPPLDHDAMPDGAWRDVFEHRAGCLDGIAADQLPAPAIVAAGLPRKLATRLRDGASLMGAILACRDTHSLVAASGLGAWCDASPRLAICITSLHVGGAERVAADLARLLPRDGVSTRLFVLDRPQRESLDAGRDAFLAYRGAPAASERLARLREALRNWGADALSLHLLSASSLEILAALDRPSLLTLHNDREGWPPRYERAAARTSLVLGCSSGVSRQAHDVGLRPVRTAWNGVDSPTCAPSDGMPPSRESLGLSPDALVVLCVANERPQKRLDRIAPVIACLRDKGIDAHAIVAGHRLREGASATTAPFVHRLGPVADVGGWMRLADVYLATSAYEGLSLAQIEAARSGLPIVATRTNGADEIERSFAACRFLDVDAAPQDVADAIMALRRESRATPANGRDGFTARSMSRRYAAHVRRVLALPASGGDGVLFVCNDFAVGGAQSSLTRLMDALRRRGVRCAAFLVGETQERPSPGTRRLVEEGHAIHAMPAAIQRDLPALAEHACAVADRGAYDRIVYWNAITEMKLRISDLAIGRRIFDVSPGEMYFRSLHRYFAAPAAALPFFAPADYGPLLDGVVVKYTREAQIAETTLGRPVHVIPNGVPMRPMATPAAGGHVRIGTLCRIAPDKKLEQLLDAVRRLRPRHDMFELVVGGAADIGQERYAEALRRSADDLPVRWLGYVAADAFLPDLDVFVLIAEPAGCPNASLEAMAHGLPVVATDVGGMNDQVVDGVTGRLVPRGDSRALAEALETLLAAPRLRAEMGRAGRSRAQSAFSLDRMADRYVQLLGLAAGRA